jgi:hypothetical protein
MKSVITISVDTDSPSKTSGLVDGSFIKLGLDELAMLLGELHSAAQRLEDCSKFITGGGDADG